MPVILFVVWRLLWNCAGKVTNVLPGRTNNVIFRIQVWGSREPIKDTIPICNISCQHLRRNYGILQKKLDFAPSISLLFIYYARSKLSTSYCVAGKTPTKSIWKKPTKKACDVHSRWERWFLWSSELVVCRSYLDLCGSGRRAAFLSS